MPTAWLVDGATPEFSAFVACNIASGDRLFLPTRRFGRKCYGWPTGQHVEITADLVALRRSLALRRATPGAAYQAASLRADARLALTYAERLPYLCVHLVIAQTLLPHLWRLGVLQGRTFDVLMERLPIKALQDQLDSALAIHPQSPTLGDFRASRLIIEAEEAALTDASRLITAHRGIAALFPSKTTLLEWLPQLMPTLRRGGQAILFPGSPLARKGAYELREAIQGLDVALHVLGSAYEHPNFWGDARVHRFDPNAGNTELAAVVLPAFVEHKPQLLLGALAAGIPVIASDACGLAAQPGLTLVSSGNAKALREALLDILATA